MCRGDIVCPPTWRSIAFFRAVSLQGKRTRASNARPYKSFSAFFISCFLIKLVKKPGTKVINLRKLGIPADKAYQWGNSGLGYWRIAGSPDLKCSITNERLAAAGYFSILNYYESVHLCG